MDVKMQAGCGWEGCRGEERSVGSGLGTKIYNIPALALRLPLAHPFLSLAARSRDTHYLY